MTITLKAGGGTTSKPPPPYDSLEQKIADNWGIDPLAVAEALDEKVAGLMESAGRSAEDFLSMRGAVEAVVLESSRRKRSPAGVIGALNEFFREEGLL